MNHEREKIIERVRKLLNMAKDAASPNEAAIAASRARKLMDQYQIASAEMMDAFCNTENFATKPGGLDPYKNIPKWIDWLSVAVAEFNDCIVKMGWVRIDTEDKKTFDFSGYESDVIVAGAMHRYLVDAIKRLSDRYFKTVQKTGRVVLVYRCEASSTLCDRLRELKEDREQNACKDAKGTSLVIRKFDNVIDHFGEPKYKEAEDGVQELTQEELEAMLQAQRDANSINLCPQVESQTTSAQIATR